MKTLNAEIRTETGKNVNRRLRSAGMLPGVLYSQGNSEVVSVNTRDFSRLFENNIISRSTVINLNITGGREEKAIVKDYQVHPVTGALVHVDFYHINDGITFETKVPLQITGTPKGAKIGGILEVSERAVGVRSLAENLPAIITVDVSNLDLNESLRASDIPLGDGVELVSNPMSIVCGVRATRATAVTTGGSEEAEEASEE